MKTDMKDMANRFFTEYVNTIRARCPIALYKTGGADFTVLVTEIIEQILEYSFGLHSEREYYRIDVIGWEDKKDSIAQDTQKLGLNAHLWHLRIAVEHENDPHDWNDELIKLAHIRCPLKVIIGYSPCNKRGEDELQKLQYAAKWLRMVDAYEEKSNDAFLLILGNSSAEKSSVRYNDFDYRGYLLDKDSNTFMQIPYSE